MSNVTIYTKDGCPYCEAAKKHYTDEGIAFTEVNISRTPDAKDMILELTKGERIVPVIVDQDEVKLGFGGG
ncbi:MAG: glutaredoxin family protein [bacterium]